MGRLGRSQRDEVGGRTIHRTNRDRPISEDAVRRLFLAVLCLTLAVQGCAESESDDTTATSDAETTTTVGSTTTLSPEEEAEVRRQGWIAEAEQAGRAGVPEWDGYWVFTVCLVGYEEHGYKKLNEPGPLSGPGRWSKGLITGDPQLVSDVLVGESGIPADFLRQEVYETPDPRCDATLTVSLTGTALSSRYGNIGIQYSGAEIAGELLLAAPGHDQIRQEVSGEIQPPMVINEHPAWLRDPAHAPFWEAASEDICAFLARSGWEIKACEP